MDDVTTNDDWTDRQQAQAAGFDAIGTRYDEVFPHKEGQIRTVEQLLERLPPGARVLDLGCALVCRPLGSSSTVDASHRRPHFVSDA
jgi:hypothetical protein